MKQTIAEEAFERGRKAGQADTAAALHADALREADAKAMADPAIGRALLLYDALTRRDARIANFSATDFIELLRVLPVVGDGPRGSEAIIETRRDAP